MSAERILYLRIPVSALAAEIRALRYGESAISARLIWYDVRVG